jgi:hypothetical protein
MLRDVDIIDLKVHDYTIMLCSPEYQISMSELAIAADVIESADKAAILIWDKIRNGAEIPKGTLTERQLRSVMTHVRRLRIEHPDIALYNLPWDVVHYLWNRIDEMAAEKLESIAASGRINPGCYFRVKRGNVQMRCRLLWVAATWPRKAPTLSTVLNFISE